MALFTIYSILQPSNVERKALEALVQHADRTATALEALVAKLSEPGGITPDEEATIQAAATALGTSAEALRAAVAANQPQP